MHGLGPTSFRTKGEGRIILHFDYDCFYAAVFEKEDPRLASLPFAVQQKQIIVTCNYEARRRGLRKLQLVREARQQCPELIIALGEDLTRFRNASNDNYHFLRQFSWNDRVEKLGFDEVFMDVTDIIDYNMSLVLPSDTRSFFHLERTDPTQGFSFDVSSPAGHTFPKTRVDSDVTDIVDTAASTNLEMRLILGTHLAQYIRNRLEEEKGYTSTAGISTNKLLAKLVGTLIKPCAQTVLMPPYSCLGDRLSNPQSFIDSHDIGKIPGIGFKTAQKLRSLLLQRPAAFDKGLIYGETREAIKVRDLRTLPGLDVHLLHRTLMEPGISHDLPATIWGLIHGYDESKVAQARDVPKQISIEDTYLKCDHLGDVIRQLQRISESLIARLRTDLTCPQENTGREERDSLAGQDKATRRRWLVHPRTIRLSTRCRAPVGADGTRTRSFARSSRSCPLPMQVLTLTDNVTSIAQKLATDTLLPLFHLLHPEPEGWDLSLINVCATNMTPVARFGTQAVGCDISTMFGAGMQAKSSPSAAKITLAASTAITDSTIVSDNALFESEQGDEGGIDSPVVDSRQCHDCGAFMPSFAFDAHERFHASYVMEGL